DPSAHVRRIAEIEPDFVAAFYSGREGISFIDAWHDAGLSARLPLVVSPLLTHEIWIDRMAHLPDGVRTASSWNPGAHTGEQEAFLRLAGVPPGRSPAVFALLGYETGRMLAAALKREGTAPSG